MIIFFSDLLQMITYQKSFSSVAICLLVVLMLAKFEDLFLRWREMLPKDN